MAKQYQRKKSVSRRATQRQQEIVAGKIIVGLVSRTSFGYTIKPAGRKDKGKYIASKNAKAQQFLGELVKVQTLSSIKRDHQEVQIIKSLGDPNNPRKITDLAIEAHEIPCSFPKAVKDDAKAAEPVTLKGRTDLREMPFVTIDGEDARDFDDAVFAIKDGTGWKLSVAIADVAHYVPAGSPLDREAYKRGNSTYFPDQVVPMLPEELSNELCSLKPNVDRASLVVHMNVDSKGELKTWQFERAVIKSHARLTYNQVQAAYDGRAGKQTQELFTEIIEPLYAAYECLSRARKKRGTLDFEFPERQVVIAKNGEVDRIVHKERLESHRLIEEFMITANVAAASELEKKAPKNKPACCLYRVHDKPTDMKLIALREYLDSIGVSLVPNDQMHPSVLAHVIEKATGTSEAELVSEMILRSLSQAVYSPENLGHFGLALARYAHFTSPIRRYADLIVHRALIECCKLGKDGLTDDEHAKLDSIGEHISKTERRSIAAERETTERFTTLYMSGMIGKTFTGRISGVASFGLFVRLDETGAEGIVPFRALPRDYYVFDEKAHRFVGEKTKQVYQLAQNVTVKLDEADKLTGSMAFKIIAENKPSSGLTVKRKPKKVVKGTKKYLNNTGNRKAADKKEAAMKAGKAEEAKGKKPKKKKPKRPKNKKVALSKKARAGKRR